MGRPGDEKRNILCGWPNVTLITRQGTTTCGYIKHFDKTEKDSPMFCTDVGPATKHWSQFLGMS